MRPSVTVLFLVTALCAGAAGDLGAQSYAPVAITSGTRIRVSTSAAERLVGNYLDTQGDTLLLATAEGNLRIGVPYSSVTALEYSHGRSRARWALAGGVGSFFAGGFIGGHLPSHDPEGWDRLAGAYLGALTGLVVGVVGGALLAPERWTTYPLR